MLRRSIAFALTVGLSLVVQGCFGNTCRDRLECPVPPEQPEPMPACDPAEDGIHGECPGIYVSSTLGSDENLGTQAQPVRTLGKALDLAQKGPRRVYACAERFEESTTVPAGIELWGGLDCAGRDWGYLGETRKTEIVPKAGDIALRVGCRSGTDTKLLIFSSARGLGGDKFSLAVRKCHRLAGI